MKAGDLTTGRRVSWRKIPHYTHNPWFVPRLPKNLSAFRNGKWLNRWGQIEASSAPTTTFMFLGRRNCVSLSRVPKARQT
jgi:hypothetical protein